MSQRESGFGADAALALERAVVKLQGNRRVALINLIQALGGKWETVS